MRVVARDEHQPQGSDDQRAEQELGEHAVVQRERGNSQPGDGGKFCRASGNTARLLTKTSKSATVMLPSKKQKKFNLNCRAMIGIIAGGGRHEKPILKAGIMHYKKKAKNKFYRMIRHFDCLVICH